MTQKLTLLLALALGFAATSCKKDKVNPDTGKELELTATEKQKVQADNAFTLKLVKQLNGGNPGSGNVFLSPLSVSFAMGMVSNGAKGQTLDAINSAINFSGFSQADINSYYGKLIAQLPRLEPNTQLSIANSIWYKQGFSVLSPFIKTNTDVYKAKVESLDFSTDNAKNTINSWVSDATKGKIPTIINSIPAETRIYLINAIYFKSIWKNRFNAADTKKMSFTTADGSTVQADFMSGKIEFKRYTQVANGKFIDVAEFPYANDRFSMVAIVPDPELNLKDLIADIDVEKWSTWTKALGTVKAQVYMPKFKFDYTKRLNENLIALGMGNAFSDQADFSGLSTNERVKITEVLQKAYIEVNENGTEATAATSVSGGVTSAPPNEFTLNRPFFFAIRERSSGLILFAGIVNNPLLTGN